MTGAPMTRCVTPAAFSASLTESHPPQSFPGVDMQPRSRLYTVLAATGITLALAACSSSTSPKPPTPHALASPFDSIYSSLVARGDAQESLIGEIVAIAAVAPPG